MTKGVKHDMTDLALLNARIENSGLKKVFLAKQLGISPQALHLKISGKNEFNSSQIQILCKVLGIQPKEMKSIFFAERVDEKSTK